MYTKVLFWEGLSKGLEVIAQESVKGESFLGRGQASNSTTPGV